VAAFTVAHRASDETALRAVREGRQAARAVDEFLMGESELPR
jgi:NADPH-dependent glutamate synthase beta subunit-like oxidoreductase